MMGYFGAWAEVERLGPLQPVQGPPALWRYMPEAEVWTYTPRALVHQADLNTVNQLVAGGYQDISAGADIDLIGRRRTALTGQLCNLQHIRFPGASHAQEWATHEDVRRVDAMPVALVFDVPADAIAHLQPDADGVKRLAIAEPLPPPQFGEMALIRSRDGWVRVNLSITGIDGLALWQRMGKALRTLAAPAEWWEWFPEIERLEDPQFYRAAREQIRSEMLASRGEAREKARRKLAILDQAHKLSQARMKAAKRAVDEKETWLAAWADVQTLAHALAGLYWTAATQAQANLDARPANIVEAAPPPVAVEVAAHVEGEATPMGAAIAADVSAAIPDDSEGADILALIMDAGDAPSLDTPSYSEDRAAREAMLSDKGKWQPEAGMKRYDASNDLAVYFGDPEHPLALEQAEAQLTRIRESTVLTVRIAEAIWNLRKQNPQYLRNGAVAINYNEILQWRGVKKHSRAAYGGSRERTTDGYRSEDRDDVRHDFATARLLYLRGHHTVYDHKGKPGIRNVDDQYIRVSFVSRPTLWGSDEHLGVFFAPGDWISDYQDVGNTYLAEIDRRVFQLNPQNEQHELKIALFLTEQWRYQANRGQYATPITMADLLQRSVIAVDKANLTSRFAPRIEQALKTLCQAGIIGTSECLTPVDNSKRNWGKAWLAARWRIMPPDALIRSYSEKLRKYNPQLSPRRPARKG